MRRTPLDTTTECGRLDGLRLLAGRYDGILCDVWGVVHNGVAAWPAAVDALARFRSGGGAVVLVTNAPRPRAPVIAQLAGLGVTAGAFDTVVTSGDVTRGLIKARPPKLFHIGPDRDLSLYEGLNVELVGSGEAETVVCTGLVDDTTETPENYRPLLEELRARNLPFICANPDIVVERGDSLVWCAGALARDYEAIGGEVHIAGKPYRPIYERAVDELSQAAGRPLDRHRVLAIGDGLATDVAGAAAFGLDLLYVSAGIHAAEYGLPDAPDADRLRQFLSRHGAAPAAWLPRLTW